MLRAYDAQQDKFKKEEAYIRRYKAGQRAKQARGRQTRLEREKDSSTLERPMELDVFGFELPRAPRSGDVVISMREASKRYPAPDGSGEKILFDAFDVSVQRGERWGIIGPNGAGKTSMVRAMLGELELDHGVARPGSSLAIGYYRQTHDGLDPDATVIEYLQRVILKEAPLAAMSEQKARDLAGAFLFSGDDQDRRLGDMSGGERGRAVLAGLLASAKNLLILDEPTNHLDIPSAERLEEALSLEGGFDGTLILISHDRAFLDAVCDRLIVLDGKGNARTVLGTYSEWAGKQREELAQQRAREAEETAKREEQQRKRDAAKQAKPDATKADPSANALARMKTDQIEAKIEKIETRLREIDAQLADPETWRDAERTDRLAQERTKLAGELEPLEFEWSRRADSA
jgi:ATP-binding cassette subfamily F protein 3